MGRAAGGKQAEHTVKACNCAHKYQDKKYGKGQRVMNGTTKDNHRCTVCGRVQ